MIKNTRNDHLRHERTPTISRIQYFLAVGRLLSVSGAAKEMHVSQPAVSEAIKSLEKELGVNLFHRIRKRLHLTEEGKYYLEKVSDVMDDLSSATREVIAMCGNRKTIRLGIPPMIGVFVFPHVFSGFKQHRPDIDLLLTEGGSLGLLQELETERIDLAIVATSPHVPLRPQGVSFQEFGKNEMMYCVSQKHPLAAHKSVPVSKLAHERLLLFKQNYLQNQLATLLLRQAGISPQVILNTNQLFTIVSFIQQNIGASFLFKSASKQIKDVAFISLEPATHVNLSLAWKTSRPQYRAVEDFLSFFAHMPGIDACL